MRIVEAFSASLVLHAVALALPTGLGIPVSRYYGAQEVSRRAQAVDDVISSESAEVERLPGSGRLVLILWIGATGVVEKVDLDQSSVDEPMASAIAAQFRATRFRPAEIDGAAVKSRMKIEVFVRPLGNPPSG